MSIHRKNRPTGEPLTVRERAQVAKVADGFQRLVDAMRAAKTVADVIACDALADSIDVEIDT